MVQRPYSPRGATGQIMMNGSKISIHHLIATALFHMVKDWLHSSGKIKVCIIHVYLLHVLYLSVYWKECKLQRKLPSKTCFDGKMIYPIDINIDAIKAQITSILYILHITIQVMHSKRKQHWSHTFLFLLLFIISLQCLFFGGRGGERAGEIVRYDILYK